MNTLPGSAAAGAQEAPVRCPSAPARSPDAAVIGVVGGTAREPRVTFLAMPVPVTPELLQATAPVSAGEVLRVAAPCAQQHCAHFRRARCSLVERIADSLPEVVEELPECGIRRRCRWFAQRGGDACWRCPQVVTENTWPSAAFVAAARTPQVPGLP